MTLDGDMILPVYNEFFDYTVVTVFSIYILLVVVQTITFLRNKVRSITPLFQGHALHWCLSISLIFFLLLEFMEQLVTCTTKHLHLMRLSGLFTSITGILTVVFSLVSYHISEKKSNVFSVLRLGLLWSFIGVVYAVKVANTLAMNHCLGQARLLLECFILFNGFVLAALDIVCYITMKSTKLRKIFPHVTGVEFVHEHRCFLSKISYHWVNGLLMTGFRRPLEIQDLGLTPKSEDAEVFYHKLKNEIGREKNSSWRGNRSFSLWRCLWGVSRITILYTALLQLISDSLPFVAPICLDFIIASLEDHNANSSLTSNSTEQAVFFNETQIFNATEICPANMHEYFFNPYVLTVLMLASYFVQVPIKKYHDFIVTREGIRLKSAMQACIFDKSLTLKMNRINEGKFANHMAVDATQIINFSFIAHYVWSLPIMVLLCMGLLFYQLGKSGAIGCFLIFVLLPVQYFLGRFLGVKQDSIMDIADRRLLKTNEMLENIKLLKMYAWENLFCQGVVKLRLKEVSIMWRTSIARIVAALVTDGIPSFACIFTFVLYYFMESRPLTLSKVFSSIVIFMMLANHLFFVAYLIVCTIKSKTSIQRLQAYFLLPQILHKDLEEDLTEERPVDGNDKGVLLVPLKTSFKDHSDKRNSVVNNGVEFNLNKVVNRNIGVDDSLEDLEPSKDETSVLKIVQATFAWYHNPVLADINFDLIRAKLTMLLGSVGSGKSSLLWALLGEMEKIKGSQEFCKSPLALVPQRAWIMNASIRENITFGRTFNDVWYNEVVSSCALETDFKLFPDGDLTDIGEKGTNLSGGQKQRVALARALYQDAQVYLLDDPLSALDPHVAATIFNRVVLRGMVGKGKTVLFVTHNTNLVKHADSVVVMVSGQIGYQGHPDSCPLSYLTHLKSDPESDPQPAKPENALEKLPKIQPSTVLPDKFRVSSLSSSSLNFVQQETGNDPPRENEVIKLITEEERQTGATPLYFSLQYIKHAGIHLVVFAILLYSLRQGMKILGDYYLGIFIDNSDVGHLDEHHLMLFCVATSISILLIPFSVCAVERFCLNASRNIHNRIIHSLAAAPMRFYDTTPIGRILNRMSADLNIVDLVLNTHLDCFLFLLTFVVGSVFVNGCFNPLFIIPAIPILFLSILLQRFFISSCRELQRLDCTTKSHILSHFSQVLSGLHIIRTSGCAARFQEENCMHINKNNLPLLFQYVTNSWLGVRLDLLGATIVFISCICSLVAQKWGYVDVNSAGVSMLYAVCNSTFLHWAMKYMSDLEIYTSNIQRLVEYCDLKSEGEDEDKKTRPPLDWPSSGDVQFRNVSLTYDKSLKPVVQNLDLSIPSGHKVGICGRTGSGKSTLTLGLFRLVDISEGEIILDKLNLMSVPIRDLRAHLSIIPQDPVLFSGTVRFNLDPVATKSDKELWAALEVSQLSTLVTNLPNKLETELSEGECNLSIGERQLLCLARALLRNSRVLVMDEATASIDQRTDQVIQGIIKSAFHDRTVLTIAHRISTIIHSDRVVVMKGGKMIEEGDPKDLMKRNTNFASLVESS